MRISLLLFTFLFGWKGFAQNLIPNGSFEEENICREYQQNCAPKGWIATSLRSDYYIYEPPLAREGAHFLGIIAGNSRREGARNFVRTCLLSGMRRGNLYHLSFYIRSRHRVMDSVGIYFSSTDFLFDKRPWYALSPQLWMDDRKNAVPLEPEIWQKVDWEYRAEGDEVFLTIGNFAKKETALTGFGDVGSSYYFFIDDIRLIPADPDEQLSPAADSIKARIYAEDFRHNLLDRFIYAGQKSPPSAVALPSTVMTVKQTVIDTITIPDVYFATGSSVLSPESSGMLESLSQALAMGKPDSVVISGHTDSIGRLAYNQKLSADRAESVKARLLEHLGLSPECFRSYGFADLRPVSSNTSAEGRQRNRRVEILVYHTRRIILP